MAECVPNRRVKVELEVLLKWWPATSVQNARRITRIRRPYSASGDADTATEYCSPGTTSSRVDGSTWPGPYTMSCRHRFSDAESDQSRVSLNSEEWHDVGAARTLQ
jgi:hypothetical protein